MTCKLPETLKKHNYLSLFESFDCNHVPAFLSSVILEVLLAFTIYNVLVMCGL